MSPILANIYLDRLDRFVEQTLFPVYNHGARRKPHPEYHTLTHRAQYLRRKGQYEKAEDLRKQYQTLPSIDPNDPGYRRLRYVRYADDFLLGFNGPREEAEEIKQQLGMFLTSIKLELSKTKSLLTHERTEAAHFLGYEVTIIHADERHDRSGRRVVNGNVGLRIPARVVRAKCLPYVKGEKPIHRPERIRDSEFAIVEEYQSEYRGIVNYYRMAHNLTSIDRLRWTMETSVLKTLAAKLRLTVNQVVAKFRGIMQTDNGPRKMIRVVVDRPGKRPLVAEWGGISLKWQKDVVLNDRPDKVWNVGQTFSSGSSPIPALCGSWDRIEVHHVRALKNLRP